MSARRGFSRIGRIVSAVIPIACFAAILGSCSDDDVATPSEPQVSLTVRTSILDPSVDHGWLTISGAKSQDYPMEVVDSRLQATGVGVDSGPHSFVVVGADVNDGIIFRGSITDTVPADVDSFSVEVPLSPALPDLIVATVEHDPASPYAGELITFSAVVRNGGVGTSAPTAVRIRVGGEASPPNLEVPALDPDETFEVERQVTLSVPLTYLVLVTVDPDQVVVETSESNNENQVIFSVSPPPMPDLIVSSLTHAPENPTTSDEITFTAIVKNIGPGEADPSVLRIRVGGEASPPTYEISALAPGDSMQIERKIVLPIALTYLAIATADADAAVIEEDESNNETDLIIVVDSAP